MEIKFHNAATWQCEDCGTIVREDIPIGAIPCIGGEIEYIFKCHICGTEWAQRAIRNFTIGEHLNG